MRRKCHLSVGVPHPTKETWFNAFDNYVAGAKNICGGNVIGDAYSMSLTTRIDQVTCWSCFRNKKFQELLADIPTKFETPRAGQDSLFELETPFSREYSAWLHDEWLKRCSKEFKKQQRATPNWTQMDQPTLTALWEKVKAETA